MDKTLCFMACGIFKHEIEAVLRESEFSGQKAAFFTPFCYFQKQKGKRTDLKIPHLFRDTCGHIEVLCGPFCFRDCDLSKKEGNIHINREQNCFNYIVNPTTVESLIERKSYLISPGFLKQWRYLIEEIWGFGKPNARGFFKESSSQIVFLDTGIDPQAGKEIKMMSSYLSLPYTVIETGLDYLKLKLLAIKNRWEKEQMENRYQDKISEAGKRIANYELSFEVIRSLVNIFSEDKIISRLLELINLLFRPRGILYYSYRNNEPFKFYSKYFHGLGQDSPHAKKRLLGWTDNMEEETRIIDGSSFLIKVAHGDKNMGYLLVEGIESRQYIQRYLDEAITVCRIVALAILNCRSYDELEKLKDRYRFLSFHDPLTSVYNRLYFEEEIKKINKNISRYLPLTVVIADINNLKKINDSFGHSTGDRTIKAVAEMLLSMVRKNDVLARIGGDEFCAILPQTDEYIIKDRVRELAEKIKAYCPSDKNIDIDVALGVYTTDRDDISLEEILKRADRLMYRDKEKKRRK
ncbi:MAG: diguanylate cyclase [Actinomycetota bacterium]